MSPAASGAGQNRYIDIVAAGLHRLGVAVRPLPAIPVATEAAAVHLHWLELHFGGGRAARVPPLARLRAQRTLRTVDQVRRRGGRLVWTVHNLKPHAAIRPASRTAHSEFVESIVERLDGFISLTAAGVDMARAVFPKLHDVPVHVARHPHYRGLVVASGARDEIRDRFSFPQDSFVLGSIGSVSPYKGVVEAAREFMALRDEGLALAIAGAVSPACAGALHGLAGEGQRISIVDRWLTDGEVADWHSAVDAVLFNGADNFNSGTVMMALSLDRPVIAPLSPVNSEIAGLVGEDWMALFEAPLTASKLRACVDKLRSGGRGESCRLDAFDPLESARATVAAYG